MNPASDVPCLHATALSVIQCFDTGNAFLSCWRCSAQLCKAFYCRILYGRYAANIYTYYYQYSITPHSVIPTFLFYKSFPS